MGQPRELIEMLAADPPDLPVEAVARAVDGQFGLCGDYAPLVSERDQNFSLRASDGRQYVVKIANPDDAAAVGGFQVALLDYLENVTTAAVPAVINTVAGHGVASIDCDGVTYALRVVSYLPGISLAAVRIEPALAADFGACLARLDAELQGFEPAGPSPESPWDLQRAGELIGLLEHIDNAAVRRLVAESIDRFRNTVLPALERLPRQAIHGDANPENVLVSSRDGRITGFIDFGDAVLAPRVVDVAVAASYLRAPASDPLRLLRPFLEGYASVAPLNEGERALLQALVCARLATTIAIMYWRAAARDRQDAYREKTLQSEAGAVDFLQLMSADAEIELLK